MPRIIAGVHVLKSNIGRMDNNDASSVFNYVYVDHGLSMFNETFSFINSSY